MVLHKQYKTLEDGTVLKFMVSFNKEKISWATGQPKKIGYQVTVIPVKITNRDGYSMEESGAFTGFNDNLIEVERQSSKRLAIALHELEKNIPAYIDYFRKKQTIS